MVTLEQFLVVVLMLLLAVVVVCGVVAVVLLRRALSDEKKGREADNRGAVAVTTLNEQPKVHSAVKLAEINEEQAQRLNEALSKVGGPVVAFTNQSFAGAYSAIIELEEMAVKRQIDEAEEASRHVIESFSQYGVVRMQVRDTPQAKGLGLSLTQKDIERRVGGGNGHPQTA